MNHNIRLFVGRERVLAGIAALHPMAQMFALTPGAEVLAIPLDDDLHDALHRVYGTGEWRREPPILSTGDMTFAAGVSVAGPLAFIETRYFGGGGYQAAVVWQEGVAVFGPYMMKAADQERRAASLWPINAALRTMGIVAGEGQDEFHAFGLGFYRSNEDIWGMAARQRTR